MSNRFLKNNDEELSEDEEPQLKVKKEKVKKEQELLCWMASHLIFQKM